MIVQGVKKCGCGVTVYRLLIPNTKGKYKKYAYVEESSLTVIEREDIMNNMIRLFNLNKHTIHTCKLSRFTSIPRNNRTKNSSK